MTHFRAMVPILVQVQIVEIAVVGRKRAKFKCINLLIAEAQSQPSKKNNPKKVCPRMAFLMAFVCEKTIKILTKKMYQKNFAWHFLVSFWSIIFKILI